MYDIKQLYNISHHGAINGVTGSCHQLSLDGSLFDTSLSAHSKSRSVLIDCGLFQGDESFDRETDDVHEDVAHLKQIDFPIDNVQALLVTHCHIDHVGRIPYLLAAGFTGPIYATKATALLLPLVIEDAIKVGVTRNRSIIRSVMKRFQSQLVAIDYNQWFDVEGFDVDGSNSALKAKFKVAGHIIGSAYIEFDVRSKNEKKRVAFSGDLGAPYSPLLPAPKSPYRCDELIIESTYGDRNHESRHNRRKVLQQTLERCLENKGTVLIPAFSIGRTQELLYEIEEMIHKGGLKSSGSLKKGIDVIVDSPLASGFTKHYRELKYLWDKEAQRKVASGRHPLAFDQLITIDSHQEHEKLLKHLKNSGRAAIVIAASGMCSGGRMQNYLQELLPDERTDVIFVGYQAKGTPGRDIQRFGPSFKDSGRLGYVDFENDGRQQRIDIRAGVYTLGGYSAHAGQKDLLNFVKRMRVKPTKIRIVHGDDGAKAELKRKFEDLIGGEVVIPNS